jgi:hypothetical protein
MKTTPIPTAAIFFTTHENEVVLTCLTMRSDVAPDPAIATALATFVAIPRLVEGLGIKPIAVMSPELREALRP